MTRNERLYQVTDSVGILKRHHMVRPFDGDDLRLRQELPGEGGDLPGPRAKTGALCAFADEDRLLNEAGLPLPEARFQARRHFVAKEECGLADSPIRAGALTVISELIERARREYISPYDLAIAFTGVGKHECALDHLERAFSERVMP